MQLIKGDITKITYGIVGHGCNCAGGFGSGVAGAIAWQWPKVKQAYHGRIKDLPPKILLGTSQAVKISDSLYVVNLFTQLDFGSDGKKYASAKAIEFALNDMIIWMQKEKLNLPIYLPKIGALRGGLDWALGLGYRSRTSY